MRRRPTIPRGLPGGFALAAALLLAGAIAVGCLERSAAAQPLDTGETLHVCSSCHGLTGWSTSSLFPNLAGQRPQYLAAQLKAFRSRTRTDQPARTYMWGMAARLSNPQIGAIAAYYAGLPSRPARPNAAPSIAAGKKIYEEGIADKGVAPCMACHGDKAQGQPAVPPQAGKPGSDAIPALAGQHRAYIEREVKAFMSKARASDVMRETTKSLSPAELRDIAAYLATL
jgi:cytochrome c553